MRLAFLLMNPLCAKSFLKIQKFNITSFIIVNWRIQCILSKKNDKLHFSFFQSIPNLSFPLNSTPKKFFIFSILDIFSMRKTPFKHLSDKKFDSQVASMDIFFYFNREQEILIFI